MEYPDKSTFISNLIIIICVWEVYISVYSIHAICIMYFVQFLYVNSNIFFFSTWENTFEKPLFLLGKLYIIAFL